MNIIKKPGLKAKIRLIQKELAKRQEISKDDVLVRELILDLNNNMDAMVSNIIMLKMGIDILNINSKKFNEIFGYVSYSQKIKWISNLGIIDEDTRAILREINNTRNNYAHGNKIRRFYKKKKLTYITLLNLLYKDYNKATSRLIEVRMDLEEKGEVLRGGFLTSTGYMGLEKKFVVDNLDKLNKYWEWQREFHRLRRAKDREGLRKHFES